MTLFFVPFDTTQQTKSYTKSRLCTTKTPPHGSIYIEKAWILAEKGVKKEGKKKIFEGKIGGPGGVPGPKRPKKASDGVQMGPFI